MEKKFSFGILLDTGNDSVEIGSAAGSADMNQWQHISVVWDGTLNANNMHMYKNGIEMSVTRYTGSGSRDSDNANNLTISDHTNKFKGTIDDVRIYNRALSAAEVNKLYQMGR